jgi:hypothetical protein
MVKNSNSGIESETGAVTLPLVIALIFLTTLSLSALRALSGWNQELKTQLMLDQCVAKETQSLLKTISSFEATNRQIRLMRVALMAQAASPGTGAVSASALQASLHALDQLQKTRQRRWNLRRAAWMSGGVCKDNPCKDTPCKPIQRTVDFHPEFPWIELPADVFGPRPWELQTHRRSLTLAVQGKKRQSAALIFLNEDSEGKNHEWQARWSTFTKGVLGAGFP